jgi:hypothetical protein
MTTDPQLEWVGDPLHDISEGDGCLQVDVGIEGAEVKARATRHVAIVAWIGHGSS